MIKVVTATGELGLQKLFGGLSVDFIAHIATELAKHQMGVNPVAGFYHDHIFVPDGREQDALDVLAKIASGAS